MRVKNNHKTQVYQLTKLEAYFSYYNKEEPQFAGGADCGV